MRDYAELVKDLRCHAGTCEYKETECSRYNKRFDDTDYTTCSEELCDDAADAIEELLGEVERAENRHVVESEMIGEMYAEIERLKAKVLTWISVEERLPEEEKPVFVTYIGYNTGSLHSDMIAYQDGEGDWRYYDGDNGSDICKVDITHWMPLPAPPKGVE